jgi:pimeloyl-ACP methyl ester carboxylesterase
VYQSPNRNDQGFVVLYLHGIHQSSLRDKTEFIKQFDHFGLHAVCPIAGPTWWTDRVCPEFDPDVSTQAYVRGSVLPFIAERFGSQPPRIGLLGTSMGGQGALKLAYKHPDTFPVVAAISPAIDYQIRYREGDEVLTQMYADAEAARQDTALLHIHPLNWPRHQFFCCDPEDPTWYDSADRLRMKLASIGVPYECDLDTTGGGHGFEYYDRMAQRVVTFLHERLERERLRLV